MGATHYQGGYALRTAAEIYYAIQSRVPQFKQPKRKAKPAQPSAQFKKQLLQLKPEQLAEVLALIADE